MNAGWCPSIMDYGAKDGMVYLAPSNKQIESGELFKRTMTVSRSEVDILAPKWTLLGQIQSKLKVAISLVFVA